MNTPIRKITIAGFFMVLLGSIGLNVYLYREIRKYYTQLYAVELDPLGLSYFLEEQTRQIGDQPTVVFFGDSRAMQWSSPQIEGFTSINRGIGNQTSTQVRLRFDAHIQPLQPDIVIVQVCINDLKTIPLFLERKREIIDNCKKNIEMIVQASLDLDATVILTTIFPTSGNVPLARKLVWSDDIYEAIKEVNRFILDLKDEKVVIFDTAGILSNPDGNTKSEYVDDLLHLNSEGYNVLNLELVKILTRLE